MGRGSERALINRTLMQALLGVRYAVTYNRIKLRTWYPENGNLIMIIKKKFIC